MTANTKIEWADHTFNPWIGCTKVGPGCDHCYAEADFDKRRHVVAWGAGQPRKRTAPSTWMQPIKWNAEAQRLGIRYRVFCASLADVFDNTVEPQWRADLFKLIEATPNLDWLLLTKRIGNAADMMFLARGGHLPLLPNVWIGATIVNQAEADRDIPKLLAVPAAKRFLSMEPLLGPVDLTNIRIGLQGESYFETNVLVHSDALNRGKPRASIDWVIVGGESGPKARPMHPDWARSLRDQCQTAGVPFLFKQWGEWWEVDSQARDKNGDHIVLDAQDCEKFEGYTPKTDCVITFDGQVLPHPEKLPDGVPGRWMTQMGKKAAGRTLDGRTWDEVPA